MKHDIYRTCPLDMFPRNYIMYNTIYVTILIFLYLWHLSIPFKHLFTQILITNILVTFMSYFACSFNRHLMIVEVINQYQFIENIIKCTNLYKANKKVLFWFLLSENIQQIYWRYLCISDDLYRKMYPVCILFNISMYGWCIAIADI